MYVCVSLFIQFTRNITQWQNTLIAKDGQKALPQQTELDLIKNNGAGYF